MLRPEVAQKRLAQARVKGWNAQRLEALAALPERLAGVGRGLLGFNEKGKRIGDWFRRDNAYEKAVEALEKLSARDRHKVFAALFPKLATHLEGAWQLCARLPYEVDYERKGFRAPGDPTVAHNARQEWLRQWVDELEGYDPDVVWCAAWAPHLSGGSGADALGLILAAAIDAGGPEGEAVFEVLRESLTNEHEVGRMGRHVTRALLVASRPEGWELVEKLLLAAQRQEGLRQVILESLDEAHPEAFRRMLRLILEHDLVRFSSVVRAADVWFGLNWESLSAGNVKKAIQQVLTFLENKTARAEALKQETGETLFYALWTAGFEDALEAVKLAAPLLKDADVERRFVAAHFLTQLDLPAARAELARCLDDEDLRVALTAFQALRVGGDEKGELFGPLVHLFDRLPARREELPALVWPWATVTADREEVADELPDHLGKLPVTVLVPLVPAMSSYNRADLAEQLAKQKKWDAATRDLLFTLVGDRDSWVREHALKAVKKCEMTAEDAVCLEALLTRKSSETRQGVLALLRKQPAALALASADRLLAAKKSAQRLGGLELLRLLVESRKAVAECRQRAADFQNRARSLGELERLHLDAILNVQRVVPTLDDALGLMRPEERSKPVEPVARTVLLNTPAAVACLKSLDALIRKNAELPVKLWPDEEPDEDEGEELLGNLSGWELPDPSPEEPVEKDAARLPLRELWEGWYVGRDKKLRDPDGLELVRAFVWLQAGDGWKERQRRFGASWGPYLKLVANGQSPVKLRHDDLIRTILQWLLRLHAPMGAAAFLLDATETAFALVPDEARRKVVNLRDWSKRDRDWRAFSPAETWVEAANELRDLMPGVWTEEHKLRWWHLMHWRDTPSPGVARMRPDLPDLLPALAAGAVTDADVYDHLLGPGDDFGDLGRLTAPEPVPEWDRYPRLLAAAERCRERVLEVELARGELPTAATGPAKALSSVWGTDVLVRLLQALGQRNFTRTTYGDGRAEVITGLVEDSYPLPADTPEDFAAKLKKAGVGEERLLHLGFLAPQWLPFVEHALGWPGLREGVWWFLAHMPDGKPGVVNFGPRVGPEGDPWERTIRDRTPLTDDEREEGEVDPEWFRRAFEPLGPKRWRRLAEASKYGSDAQGHKKAVFLSDVLLGRVKRRELIAGIRERQLKENVRLLGLLPLPADPEKREADVQARWRALLSYRRYARSLGPLSREPALRALEIGLHNLARTAGYPDPVRLEWALEAREVADLAAGPVEVTHQGVTVTLRLDESAQPELTVRRGDRPLKAIPPKVRKSAKVAALAERRAELKRQGSRMRQSLEASMVRGDPFTGAELKQLFAHPLLAPLLGRLVLIGEGIRGYPVSAGQGLADYTGKVEPIKADEKLLIAHPNDLLSAGDWDKWQADCFARERVQPFKQVFRELYVVTAQEKKGGPASERYAGQQVNPAQAMALFGARGWSTREGVMKTFHDAGLSAEVTFRHHGWTAAQVEGLTLATVAFRKRGEWKPLPLKDVPPRLFSEVMRDVDLVVSVAHLGGVDPEASASTVQMRSALLRETCALLKLDNVRYAGNHAVIDGQLGKYTVHLGSAVVHRQPGGALCIVPVGAQQRGRLFLPFADDDPRTAEVVSKVILLARDGEIQDPSILEQLR
jgi:hypothetical protein